MKILLVFSFSILVAGSVWSLETSKLHPVRLAKGFGFGDKAGNLVIPARYDWAWPFSEGRAGVRIGKDWFLLDEQGKRLSPERYDWVGPFRQGLAPARLGRKWGYIGRDGAWKIDPYFSDARPFREGLAAVQVGGDYAIVDKTSCFDGIVGVDLSPPMGDRVVPAASGGKWGLIDGRGVFLVEPKWAEVRDASEGRVLFRKGTEWGFLDLSGHVVVSPQYLAADPFHAGWARVTQFNGQTGFINLQGKFFLQRLEETEKIEIENQETSSGK